MVIVILDDFRSDNQVERLLIHKLRLKGYAKWLSAKHHFLNNYQLSDHKAPNREDFIPIEFMQCQPIVDLFLRNGNNISGNPLLISPQQKKRALWLTTNHKLCEELIQQVSITWEDREMVIQFLKRMGNHYLGYLLAEFTDDIEICLAGFESIFRTFRNVPLEMLNNAEFVSSLIERHGEVIIVHFPYYLNNLPVDTLVFKSFSELLSNREFMIKAVEKEKTFSMNAQMELERDLIKELFNKTEKGFDIPGLDTEFALELLQSNPNGLSFLFPYLPESMRDDEELVLKLKGNINMQAISSVSTRLLHKPDFILRSIANGFTVIEGMSQELQTNREFISNACKINPLSLVVIGSHFRNDLELVKEALFHPQLFEFKEYWLVAKVAARTLNHLEHPIEFNFACNLAPNLISTLPPNQAMEVIRNNNTSLHYFNHELSVEFMEEMCEIHGIVKLTSESVDFERFLQLRMNYEYQGGNITDFL